MPLPVSVAFSSKSNEYYTPKFIVNAVKFTFGGNIDLDPASCVAANKNHVQAKKIYTRKDNGLEKPWFGNVFCNPPRGVGKGGSQQGVWGNLMLEKWQKGEIEQGIILVRSVIGYKWFTELWRDYPYSVFLDKLVTYYQPNPLDKHQTMESNNNDKLGTTLFCCGVNPAKLTVAFTPIATVIKAIEPFKKIKQKF